ncbi:MAG TPA: hypothetical protein VGV86_05435, partial [Acidimicrobiales bacterium]|nr:hypothetical protein [Acidimicrobiales bacterium]
GRLEKPVTFAPDTSLAEARLACGASSAAVIDVDGRLVGELRPGDASGEGTVGDRSRPVTATVAATATLKDVSSALLLSDSGWVAVVDGDRLLGVLTPEAVHAAARRAAGR